MTTIQDEIERAIHFRCESWNKQPRSKDNRLDLSNKNIEDILGGSPGKIHVRGGEFINSVDRYDFSYTDLVNSSLEAAYLSNTKFNFADLSEANLSSCFLQEADFTGANLTNASLSGSDLTSANFENAIFNDTKLDKIIFRDKHTWLDGSDSILLSGRDRFFRWSNYRALSTFPVFGISWAAFLLAVTIVNGIGFINKHLLGKVHAYLHYPVQIPDQMGLLIVSSILLAIGSSCYAIGCPSRIKEFSETEWVEQHGHPRLLYIAKDTSWGSWRRNFQVPTFGFLAVGGAIALILGLIKLVIAIGYFL